MKILRFISLSHVALAGTSIGAISLSLVQNSLFRIVIFMILALSLVNIATIGVYDLRKNPWKDFSTKSSNTREVMTLASALLAWKCKLSPGFPRRWANMRVVYFRLYDFVINLRGQLYA